ncbi:hypothetical protein B0J13DRAFT_589057 [Dactylonectria estremocensis]|uniref:Uncharacterized protein n=1 Tax=Dactylonectria estremocensis TaxID=1079267 RepID=A0A9P9DTX0_9HYPO|nr:hypothetical protein B0J13DRAFT_589057 [Dactylonectria estremocensis]
MGAIVFSLLTCNQPVSIITLANRLVHDRVEENNTELVVFQAFCANFLDYGNRELSGAGSAPTPTYSSGQPATTAPPREDLGVFIRLEAGAPARTQNSYAIRTRIREKFSAILNKIRQTTDIETRDLLIEKQAKWAADLGATTIETNKK